MVITFTVIVFTALVLTHRADLLRLRMADALALARISRKAAAITMHLTEQRLSEALHGKSPLSVFRLADLPDAFWDAFDELDIKARGGIVLQDARLARLVDGLEFVMAKADLPSYGRTVQLPLGQKAAR